MKKTFMSLATVGLLLSAGAAFSQNTDSKTQTPAGSATTQSQINTKSGERSESKSGERREGRRGDRHESRTRSGSDVNVRVRSGERSGMRVRERGERSSINVRVRGGDDHRYRRHHRHMGVYVGGCRTIIVKKWHHGHRVIKRIRHCG
jgi:hypothetical protein